MRSNLEKKKLDNPRVEEKNKCNSAYNENDDRFSSASSLASLREDQVGITEYTTATAGIKGILKSRFSDFQVNEVDKTGKILILNNLSLPQIQSINSEELVVLRKDVEKLITNDQWIQIEKLASVDYKKEGEKQIYIDVSTFDKEKRTQLHTALKKLYPGKFATATVAMEGSVDAKCIRIMRNKPGADKRSERWTLPGDYVHFLVYKENKDTTKVALALANKLRMQPSQINFCGTKDKRGKTTQKFCIKKRTPKQIVDAVEFIKGVHVGNFEFSNEVIKLGDLKGNHFRIALRHVIDDRLKLEETLGVLSQSGFINYFGMQRFGNSVTVPTYEVGVALLKRDYKLACELILKPRVNDVEFMHKIRTEWWDKRDSAAAAQALSRYSRTIEKKLIDGLAQYGENDYASALRKIPRNMLMLYLHAYQSLIFNRIASRRIKQFGFKLISGDLVYCNKEESDHLCSLGAELDMQENDLFDDTYSIAVKLNNTENETESIFKRKVRPLTDHDIASGNYTLFDIVLPLPGHDITYPNNEVGDWYQELLKESGLSSETLKHKVKTYSMAGAYRKLLIQPIDLKWQFRKYESVKDDLILSDWDKINNVELPNEPDDNDSYNMALLLEFSLPMGAYATMFLRELLKSDTSASNQAQMEQNELKKENMEQISPTISTSKRKLSTDVKTIDDSKRLKS